MDKEFATVLAFHSSKENFFRMTTPDMNYSCPVPVTSSVSIEQSTDERRPTQFGDSTNSTRSDRQFPLKKRIRDIFDTTTLASNDSLEQNLSGDNLSKLTSALSWDTTQHTHPQPLNVTEVSSEVSRDATQVYDTNHKLSVSGDRTQNDSKIRTAPIDEEVIDIGTEVVDSLPVPTEDIKPIEIHKKRKVTTKSRENSGPKHTVVVTLKGEDFDRSPMKSRIPNSSAAVQKRARLTVDDKKGKKWKKKVMKDDLSELCNVLEIVWKRMRDHPDAYPFLAPVQVKHAPDYYSIITKPMDLRTIHEKLVRYANHREFLADVKQMIRNCHLYNKDRNPELPPMADTLYKVCKTALREMRRHIVELEKKSEDRQKLTQLLPTGSIWDDPNIDILTSSPLSTPDEESEIVDIDDTFNNLESVMNT